MERSSPLRILVAKDDVKTAHLIETYLRNKSFDSVLAFEGPIAIANFSSCAPSLAGFLVASAFSLWFYFRLISPIHQLTSSVQLISGGDYSLRVFAAAPDTSVFISVHEETIRLVHSHTVTFGFLERMKSKVKAKGMVPEAMMRESTSGLVASSTTTSPKIGEC